ncbi:hypothetical protein OGH69_02435 [Flavobacterium sp. MFBS3-15]|uniref:hypothetical protein n=1 Tax=Flavobacterium sp. MFBS3-15 TaxID=2989816 RepID=UPI002235A8DE|nr:hypothetical protein [Flavobacterium sp. MFBS3-15]MCW4467808.1 hypothetical protein [Flavobacterium sp. MFBS3-15]
MKLLAFFALTLFSLPCIAQTATIKFMPGIGEEPNGYRTEFALSVNGKPLKIKDSLPQKIHLAKKGFDRCTAIIGKDTLHFLAKFRKDEKYIVQPGCCCSFFILKPENNPQRGTVSFTNNTKESLLLIAGEANIEEVAPDETKTEFTYESAMCTFKPCSIVIAKTAYNDPKYDYDGNGKDYDTLWAEQEKYIVDGVWFHFMHGEKITAELNEATGKITLKPDGYLSRREHQKFYTE